MAPAIGSGGGGSAAERGTDATDVALAGIPPQASGVKSLRLTDTAAELAAGIIRQEEAAPSRELPGGHLPQGDWSGQQSWLCCSWAQASTGAAKARPSERISRLAKRRIMMRAGGCPSDPC